MCMCVHAGISVTEIILAQAVAFFITQVIQSIVLFFFIVYVFDVSLCVVLGEPDATVFGAYLTWSL